MALDLACEVCVNLKCAFQIYNDVFTFLIYLLVYLSAAAGVNIASEPQFVLIGDDDIKNLKV